MQVKSIAECSEASCIKIFVLSIFEWPFKTDFTVEACCRRASLQTNTSKFKGVGGWLGQGEGGGPLTILVLINIS